MAPCPANKSMPCLYAACLTHLTIDWIIPAKISVFLNMTLCKLLQLFLRVLQRSSWEEPQIHLKVSDDNFMGVSHLMLLALQHASPITPSIAATRIFVFWSITLWSVVYQRFCLTGLPGGWTQQTALKLGYLLASPHCVISRKMEFIIRLLWESHVFQQP